MCHALRGVGRASWAPGFTPVALTYPGVGLSVGVFLCSPLAAGALPLAELLARPIVFASLACGSVHAMRPFLAANGGGEILRTPGVCFYRRQRNRNAFRETEVKIGCSGVHGPLH
jgi:hypothetical protein